MDRPARRSVAAELAKIEAELSTAVEPAGDAVAQAASRVDPRAACAAAVSNLGGVLRRDRLQAQGAAASRPWGVAYIAPSTLPPRHK